MRSTRRGNPCKHCHRTMRVRGERIEDHPNTVLHTAKGLCVTCSGRQRRAEFVAMFGAHDTEPLDAPLVIKGLDSDEQRVRTAALGAQHYLDDRRARGVPVAGINIGAAA